jgi:hypothetical protein
MKATTLATLLISVTVGMGGSAGVLAQDPQAIVVKRITVVDELARPVMATLNLLDAANKETFFADTDESGVAEPNKPCPVGTRVRIYPAVPRYLAPARYPPCLAEMRIPLRRAGVAIEMAKIADTAFKEGKFGRAAMVYSDAAYRLSTTDAVTAEKLEIKVYESVAKKFEGIKFYDYDSEQNKTVLTTEGIGALRNFQTKNSLPVTGQLDFQTTQKLAAEPVFPHIRSAYEAIEKKGPN